MRIVEQLDNRYARLLNPQLDVRKAIIEDVGVTFIILMMHTDVWNVVHHTTAKCVDIDAAFEIATAFVNQ